MQLHGLSASDGWMDSTLSMENPALLKGPLWPIKDMERAYLKSSSTHLQAKQTCYTLPQLTSGDR